MNELLERAVEEIIDKESLSKKINEGRPLRIKLGIDPTGPNVHLGRAAVLWKLKAFQDLSHQIVLIVGDFTALVGDPSDKLSKRPMLSREQIEENLKKYKEQLSKIIDLQRAEFHYNSEWLSGLKFDEVCKLAESFSVQQMLARRNFRDRYENQNEISLREFMYPLMQGYDSVAVKADVEIGGFDQLFNLKAGRIIQKAYGQKEQDILTTIMLEGTDGRKMSTTWGNVININDEPNDMFGKVMSLKDDLILKYFLLATSVSQKEIKNFEKQLKDGTNPKDIKIKLAEEIVTLYHGPEKAQLAKNNFANTFEQGGIPTDIKEVFYKKGTSLSEIFIKENVIPSKTEWRRLIKDGAIKEINKQKENIVQEDDAFLKESIVYKIGKRRFLKITIS